MAAADNTDNLLGLVNQVDPTWGKTVNNLVTPEVIKLFSTPSLITTGTPGLAFLHAWGLGVTIGQAAAHELNAQPTTADKTALTGYASLSTEFTTANDAFGFAFLGGLATFGAYAPVAAFLTDAETSLLGLSGVLTSLSSDSNSFVTSFTNNPSTMTGLQSTITTVLSQPGL